MANRNVPVVVALALLLLAGGVAGTELLRPNPRETELARSPWVQEGVTLVWAVRPKDLISCRSAGYSLRRVQRAYGDVRLVVASVDADTPWVASMLRSERLTATIRQIPEREYRSFFSSTATPRIYVLHDGQLVSSHVLNARDVRERDGLEQVLRRLAVRS